MRANSPARRRNADRKGGVSVLVSGLNINHGLSRTVLANARHELGRSYLYSCSGSSVSVAAVPELPKVDLSQPVEIDIIDAERYVLFDLEVTAVA